MPDVPRVTAAQVIKAFGKVGFQQVRKTGSHCILKKSGHRYILSIPEYGSKTVGLGLLRSQIEVAGLTIEEFIALL